MIIRIQGEGQFRLDDAAINEINVLDTALESALAAGDEEFAAALAALLDRVRAVGEALADEELLESDVILPSSDATAHEVRRMLQDDGLVPG